MVRISGSYNYIFHNCGFDGRGGFTNTMAVYQPLALQHDPCIKVIKFESVSNGKKDWFDANGSVVGQLYKNGVLPAYHFQIQIGTQIVKRKIIAQNIGPEKSSNEANAARAGACIAWVIAENTILGCYNNGVFVTK